MTRLQFRRPHTSEYEALSTLAYRSKAHWGYDEAFMNACRAELTVTPDRLPHQPVEVLEVDGTVVGLFALDRLDDETVELDLLFLAPEHIGKGYGRKLVDRAKEVAFTQLEGTRLRIQGDPHAEGFYLAMGARPIGSQPSVSIPGRNLPLFELRRSQ